MKENDLTIEKIVADYLRPVYNFVLHLAGNRTEADDLTQEVFVKVWKNLARYDTERNFKTWLFRIARNTVIDWLRKKKNLTFTDLSSTDREFDFAENLLDLEPLPEELFARAETRAKLDQALAQISPARREVIIWHLFDDLTFVEIAEITDQPLNTVKSQYRRALFQLRQILTLAPK